jgi:hypothetical protein
MNLQRALEIFNLENLNGLDERELKSIFKRLAKERHPDQGGSNSDFVQLKEAHIILEQELEDGEIQTTGNDLKTLSKEEILNKYYQDTHTLQSKIENLQLNLDNHAEALEHVKQGAVEVMTEFEVQKTKLKQELDISLEALQKEYNSSFLKRLFFFKQKMSEQDFWNEYHQHVHKYVRKTSDLNVELYKVMVNIYGEGLNNISRLTGRVDKIDS